MFDRFTRDEVSQWVWWPAAMVLLVLFVLTFPGEGRAISQRRAEATSRASSLATGAIEPALVGEDAGAIRSEAAEELSTLAADGLIAAPWTEVVRIWAADGTLLWSSDARDQVGSAAGLNDGMIARTIDEPTLARQVVTGRGLDGEPAPPTFSAYAPFSFGGRTAAAQFQVAEETLTGDLRDRWLGFRIVIGAAGLLTLAFAVGSLREPVARIGARVSFGRSSLPRGMEVIETERKLELERAGATMRERVTHLEARLHESEELRLRAEGDLQRALSLLADPPDEMRSVILRSAEIPAVSSEASTVTVPPSAEPTARPGAVVGPVEPLSTLGRSQPADRATPTEPLVRIRDASPARPAEGARLDLTVDVDDPDHPDDANDADARVVLERLVEPVGAATSTEDPGALRARLERTAAQKKPGSRHDDRLRSAASEPG